MAALQEFDVRLSYCFTPEHRGIVPHYTSPALIPEEFADFCARMTHRYAPVSKGRRSTEHGGSEVGDLETAIPC